MKSRYKIVKRQIDMVTFPRIASIPNGISCSINEMTLALISDFYLMEKNIRKYTAKESENVNRTTHYEQKGKQLKETNCKSKEN